MVFKTDCRLMQFKSIADSAILKHQYSKTCRKRPLEKKRPKMFFKTDCRLMQVKSIAECSNSAILLTFIKLPFVINIFVLSNFEWMLKTGFTVF